MACWRWLIARTIMLLTAFAFFLMCLIESVSLLGFRLIFGVQLNREQYYAIRGVGGFLLITGTIFGALGTAYCAYRLWRVRSWFPKPKPAVVDTLPVPAAYDAFLWNVQVVKMDHKNQETLMRYVSNTYDAHCVKGLHQYNVEPELYMSAYADAKEEILWAVTHNLMWYSDMFDDAAQSYDHLNGLGAGSWRHPSLW